MADKSVSETLEQFVENWCLGGVNELTYGLARAVEQRAAERCAEIAESGGTAHVGCIHRHYVPGAATCHFAIGDSIRREFKLETK